MCIIVDTNTFHKFKEPDNEDMEPVWTWLEKRDGKIAYADIEKLEDEWDKGGMQKLRNRLRQTGKLKVVSPEDVQEKADELKGKIKSDDEHIIALGSGGQGKDIDFLLRLRKRSDRRQRFV